MALCKKKSPLILIVNFVWHNTLSRSTEEQYWTCGNHCISVFFLNTSAGLSSIFRIWRLLSIIFCFGCSTNIGISFTSTRLSTWHDYIIASTIGCAWFCVVWVHWTQFKNAYIFIWKSNADSKVLVIPGINIYFRSWCVFLSYIKFLKIFWYISTSYMCG